MQRLTAETEERLAVWTLCSPETSDIFNNPDRRVTLTTPAVLIIPDITTSSSGCRGRMVRWGCDSAGRETIEGVKEEEVGGFSPGVFNLLWELRGSHGDSSQGEMSRLS